MNKRLPVSIPVQPWFKDHRLGSKIVLAAVETMIQLASTTRKKHPSIDIRVMEDALFAKFLEIPPQAYSIAALVECDINSDGRLHSKLLSQVQIGTMKRIKEHGEISFLPVTAATPQAQDIDLLQQSTPVQEVSSELLYRKLVPFGSHYHTLQDKLYLSKQGAWGKLRAPKLPFTSSVQKILGSPFPLDGAMHAACVMGQQFVDYTPFPIGFRRRIISRPTQPGGEYITRVIPICQTADEQIYDLGIFDTEGTIFETVTGLRMRDASKVMK